MNLLLDTHALLWWMNDAPLLRTASEAIADPANAVSVSPASVWEIAIKRKADKLTLPGSIVDRVERSGFTQLPISAIHAEHAGGLPLHHRDPFDRLLIAQAQLEGLTIVTRDPRFNDYRVKVLAC